MKTDAMLFTICLTIGFIVGVGLLAMTYLFEGKDAFLANANGGYYAILGLGIGGLLAFLVVAIFIPPAP